MKPISITVKTNEEGYSPILSNFNAPGHRGIDVWLSGSIPDSTRLQLEVKLTRPEPDTISWSTLSQPFFLTGDTVRVDDGLVNGCFRLLRTTRNEEAIIKSDALPESIYHLDVFVIDHDSKKCLSNISRATLIIKWLDPPELRSPVVTSRRTIRFDWSIPPSLESQNEYTLEIVKLTEQDANPAEAFVSDQAIFSEATQASFIEVPPNLFKPHERYAARVVVSQSVRLDQFKNHGYSDIILFNSL